VEYAYQELDTGLGGVQVPPERKKPWGTGHAILTGKDAIAEPFAVINADDYCGRESLRKMADFPGGGSVTPENYAMVGFKIRNTLSEQGTVAQRCTRKLIEAGVSPSQLWEK